MSLAYDIHIAWDPRAADTLAEACLKLPLPVVLVLDDYHLISEPGIHTVLFHVIQYASAKLHLVVVTRQDPPLGIGRLRARQQITEIRAANLRLTERETNDFMESRLEQKPSAELLAKVQARTEGWVAGLQLTALAMEGFDDLDAFVDDMRRHDNLYVMDYLFDEVLDHEPDDVKEFLLKTALLVRFNVPLAAQATKRDAASCRRILDQLRREHLFIVALDSEHDWYRYHHQFHAMLADRARVVFSAGEVNAVRSNAANWLASHGWIDEALTEYITDGLWEMAADLVEVDRHRLQNAEEWNLLWLRISRLLDHVVAQRPGLLLGQAWILQVHERLSAIPPLVDQAEALLSAAAPTASVTFPEHLQGEVYALRGSWIFSKTSAEQRIDTLHQALPLLPAREFAWVRGFVYIQLAVQLVHLGQSDAARRQVVREIEAVGPGEDVYLTRLHHALASIAYRVGSASELLHIGLRHRELATMNQLPLAMSWAHFAVGWAHYQRCEPTLAMEALLPVFDQPYRVHLETLILALVALVPVAAELGEGEQASRLVEQASRIALERKNIAVADELSALAAYAALLRRDRTTTLAWAKSFVQSGFRSIGGKRRDPEISSQVPVFARIALAHGSTAYVQEAIVLLKTYVSLYKARSNMVHTVHGAVLLACCHWRIGQAGQALDAMQLAVDIGWPRGFRCAFFEQGAEVARMLYAMIQRGMSVDAASALLSEYGEWSAGPPHNIASGSTASENAIVPLSEREVEVLVLLDQRLTNKEIAHRLGISFITVRNHASRIYSKLGVASRKQAVAQARRLGLLPPSSTLHLP